MEKGTHILLDVFFDCFSEELENISFWQKLGEQALKEGRFSVLESSFHNFDPCGLSAFWLLSESHLSVHSWPEKKRVFIDLFSCGGKDKSKKAADFLIANLEDLGGKVEKKDEISRGFIFKK